MVHLVKIYFIIIVQTSETDGNYEEICSTKLICLVSHKVDTVTLRKQVEVYQRLFLGHPEKMETSKTFEIWYLHRVFCKVCQTSECHFMSHFEYKMLYQCIINC